METFYFSIAWLQPVHRRSLRVSSKKRTFGEITIIYERKCFWAPFSDTSPPPVNAISLSTVDTASRSIVSTTLVELGFEVDLELA